jgi:hypothetical protein
MDVQLFYLRDYMKRIGFQGLIFIFFIFTAFLSVNFAHGLLYSMIFTPEFSRKINYWTVFFISLFLDVYSFAFVGITSIATVILYIFARRFRSAFQNFGISFGYFFLSLVSCKIALFSLINLLGYNFNMHSNLTQMSWALLVHTICYFMQIANGRGYYVR